MRKSLEGAEMGPQDLWEDDGSRLKSFLLCCSVRIELEAILKAGKWET